MGRMPEYHMQRGGIYGNPGSSNHPKKRPPTSAVTLKDISGSSLPDQIHTRNQHTNGVGGGEGGRRQESVKIHQHELWK